MLTSNNTNGTFALSANAASAGTCTFTVKAIDTAGATLSQNYTLTVNPALSIFPTSLAQAQVSISTNQTITVSNGTLPYSTVFVNSFVAGGTGLTTANLTANTAAGTVALSGTPTGAGTATFKVNVIDKAGATLTQNYSLTVVSIFLTPASLPAATATALYSQTLTVSGAGLPLNNLSVTALVPGSTGLVTAKLHPQPGDR